MSNSVNNNNSINITKSQMKNNSLDNNSFKKSDDEIKQCIKCLIPSRRYVVQSANGSDTDKFGILIHNNLIEGNYNKDFIYSIPVDYSFCIEKDKDSENGKKGQFYYLEIY